VKRTLYIHIGAHRTATTSAQKFMQTNFVRLQEKGFFNPFAAGRHFALINRIFRGEVTVAETAADLEERADAKKYSIHTIVLSDEDICTRRDLSPLADFRERFDVKIVMMLRRQDLWIESWYQQNVKWQWKPDLCHLRFDAFLARRDEFFWIDYDRTLRQCEDLFGRANVIARVFEPAQMPQGANAMFCDAIGLRDLKGLIPYAHVNSSLSPLMTEFMRTLPLHEAPGSQRRIFEQACTRVDGQLRATHGKQSSLYMDAATRQAVLAEYDAGNRAVAQRHFGRDSLILDPLPPRDAPLAQQDLPADSQTTMEMLVAPMVRALIALRKEEADAADKSSR